jgi:hypothetical protein
LTELELACGHSLAPDSLTNICQLRNLRRLSVNQAPFVDLPADLANLTELEYLDFGAGRRRRWSHSDHTNAKKRNQQSLSLLPKLRTLLLVSTKHNNASHLALLSNLTSLDMSSCHITDADIDEIVGGLRNLDSLKVGSTAISEASVVSIATHCTKLRHLDLSACANISEVGLFPLYRKCPFLHDVVKPSTNRPSLRSNGWKDM